ncbi:MAG: hypothetical protein HW419_1813 [Deltaproteobacteria bacterium]|nr:hypothetical protein [Deltaproteobacteria bacterium]
MDAITFWLAAIAITNIACAFATFKLWRLIRATLLVQVFMTLRSEGINVKASQFEALFRKTIPEADELIVQIISDDIKQQLKIIPQSKLADKTI